MDNQLDSESYWSGSQRKAFSFDDDEVDYDEVGSTTSLGQKKWDNILNDDTISEASFESNATSVAVNFSIKSVISDEILSTILHEQTIDDRIISKNVKPDEELKLLRRQIQTTLYSPSAEVTAYKLGQGKNVPLEVFKSLQEKQELLDAVMQNGGGDTVIGVLLFLKRTLNETNFYKTLQERPKALQHYIDYLTTMKGFENEAIMVLQQYGRHQEAATLEFKSALACNDLQKRKQKLCALLENKSYTSENINSLYRQLFHANLKLLDLVEKERNTLDNLVDLNSTPIEVLYACCRKHNNWKDQDVVRSISPFRISAEQQISAAQFEWTALNELATRQAYADLESVFERVPTWHPMKQKQFHISFSLNVAILRLHALQAPSSVLYLFLSKINDADEKLDLARKVKCCKAEIDALAALKDLNQLIQLKERLPERSEEQFYCDKAIKGFQGKRWSTDNIKIKL